MTMQSLEEQRAEASAHHYQQKAAKKDRLRAAVGRAKVAQDTSIGDREKLDAGLDLLIAMIDVMDLAP